MDKPMRKALMASVKVVRKLERPVEPCRICAGTGRVFNAIDLETAPCLACAKRKRPSHG